MTLIQVFDRLRNQSVNRIDFKNGPPVICPEPSFVGFDDKDGDPLPEIWLNATDEGLTVSFNAKHFGGYHGHEEPLSNIAQVS